MQGIIILGLVAFLFMKDKITIVFTDKQTEVINITERKFRKLGKDIIKNLRKESKTK